MNDLIQQEEQKNQLVSQSTELDALNKLNEIDFRLIHRNISYKDFDFKKWTNKLLKIKLEGNFPIKIGSALLYKREKITHIGILLGADINSRVFSILDNNGSNTIYIPFDGTMDVYEGCYVQKRINNEMF